MADGLPPFPPSGTFIQSVRSSCRALRLASSINIESSSINRLLHSEAFTHSFQSVSKYHGLALPLKFPSYLAELNCICILSLLNFASGYRQPLHSETGRGAWDNIRALVLTMYVSSSVDGDEDYMSARGMKTIGLSKISEFMHVNVHVEKPHKDLPLVMVGSLGGPLYELVKLIQTALNETGQILVQSGYPDLGTFVAEALKSTKDNDECAADVVIERLVRAFPAFRDMAFVNGQAVYLFKKALFLIYAIHVRFSSMSPRPFPIPAINHLPVFTDNVLPSMLIHLGVLDVRTSPYVLTAVQSMIPEEEMLLSRFAPAPAKRDEKPIIKEGPMLNKEQAYILRASAIDACELIVAEARQIEASAELGWITTVSLPQLDLWLWAVAKDRQDFRALERFAERGTLYY